MAITRIAASLLMFVLLLAETGCDVANPASPPPSGVNGNIGSDFAAAAPATLSQSLFKEDQAAISNAALAEILSAKVTLPPRAKLTVIRFGQLPYWWGWSEDFVRTNQSLDDTFLAKLAASPRLREVAYLPSLVTPTEMTLPKLRSAAARFQSDLLLVYRTSTSNYQRQRIFHEDETKAYCTVEAILLDVRTGIIPFSTVVTEQFEAKKQSGDYDFSETQAKANQQAIGQAWQKLAGQVTAFLQKPQTD